jgi:hypothetical protein
MLANSKNMKCTQCELLMISYGQYKNVPVHEIGCPNAYNSWDEESQTWVSPPVEDNEAEEWWNKPPEETIEFL